MPATVRVELPERIIHRPASARASVPRRASRRVCGSRRRRRPLAHACHPRDDVGVGRIERLADLSGEIEPAIEQNVRQREALAAEIVAAVGHLAVEPLQAIGGDHLEPRRRLGRTGNPLLEKLQAFAEAEAIAHMLADVEIDAARPHPAFGALFRRRPDHRGIWMLLFEIFADRGDLGEIVAVVEFERRHLAVRVALQMLGLAVLALAQIDGLFRHLDALFRHEHADHARVRPDRVVELHGISLPLFSCDGCGSR